LLEKADPRVFGVIVNRLKAYKGGHYAATVQKYAESEAAASQLLQEHLDSGRAATQSAATGADAEKVSRWRRVWRWFKRQPAPPSSIA
jgi:hypothetical protein